MVRMIIRFGLSILASAIGLIVAAVILDDMTLSGAAFVVAAVIFTVATVILQPLMTKIAMDHMQAIRGATALVTTLIGLILTSIISDGLAISGATTWVLATLIVWFSAMLAGIILPALFLKEAVQHRRSN